jgi:hypothetical protein
VRAAFGGRPYAIGYVRQGVFRVRCIRFGMLHASFERRDDEEIRATEPFEVSETASRPAKTGVRALGGFSTATGIVAKTK